MKRLVVKTGIILVCMAAGYATRSLISVRKRTVTIKEDGA